MGFAVVQVSPGCNGPRVEKSLEATTMTTGALVVMESAGVEKPKRTRKTHHKGEWISLQNGSRGISTLPSMPATGRMGGLT